MIGAGGTAGHVVPALAVADALRALGADVAFIGGERAELELVPAAGYELRQLRVLALPRRSPLAALRAAAIDSLALRRAGKILHELSPSAVLGAGGYVAGPVGLAGVLQAHAACVDGGRQPSRTDQSLAGTRSLAASALPFALEGRDGAKYRVTGRPVPPPATDRAAARKRFGIGPEETCVLIFGGSLGARSINLAAIEAFAGAHFHVLHAAGERDIADLQSPGPALRPTGVHLGLRGGPAGQ